MSKFLFQFSNKHVIEKIFTKPGTMVSHSKYTSSTYCLIKNYSLKIMNTFNVAKGANKHCTLNEN